MTGRENHWVNLLVALLSFLTVMGCTSGTRSTSQNDSQDSLNQIMNADTTLDITRIWNENDALNLITAGEPLPEQCEIEKVNGHILGSNPNLDYAVINNAMVGLFKIKKKAEAEEMYPTYCPKLAVFSADKRSNLILIALSDLECSTNYDDNITSISLGVLDLADTLSVITIIVESRGWSGENESSASHQLLYAVSNNHLVSIGDFELSTSENGSETSTGKITISSEITLGLPDIKYFYSEANINNLQSIETRYCWDGEKYFKCN